jgi:hypothetical protein
MQLVRLTSARAPYVHLRYARIYLNRCTRPEQPTDRSEIADCVPETTVCPVTARVEKGECSCSQAVDAVLGNQLVHVAHGFLPRLTKSLPGSLMPGVVEGAGMFFHFI